MANTYDIEVRVLLSDGDICSLRMLECRLTQAPGSQDLTLLGFCAGGPTRIGDAVSVSIRVGLPEGGCRHIVMDEYNLQVEPVDGGLRVYLSGQSLPE